jgi:hypothetical protein
MASMTMIQALRSAMDVMLGRDDNVVIYGQDVGYFGGVFRCTDGLQAKYGTGAPPLDLVFHGGSGSTDAEISEAVSSGSSDRDSDSECDDEEETLPARGGGWARRLFLLLVSAACLLCYVYCMSSSTPFPATTSDEPHNFVGWNGSAHGVGGREVFSLLGPVDMMGLEDGPEAIVYSDSEDGIPLRGPGGSPSNFMAVAMMGMADACPNVPLGEFSCQIEGESSENVDVLKEDSHIGDLKSEAVTGGDALEDSSDSTHSHDTSMEEGLVYQEKGEDDSEHSMEKTMEPESAKVENDDEELHSLEYGNTAGAARQLIHMGKKLWPAVEPHLLKMLACLSVAAAFVTAMLLKYSRRSRKANVPVSRRTPSAPPARVPVLAPHSVAQPTVFRSEQPVHRPMPKPEPSSCLELPVQSVLTRPDPPASLNVPSVGHGNRDQMIQQGDGGIVRASDDKSMPPVVQLLGEFSYVDTGSSRGRPVKDSSQHGGDIRVQESTPPRKDVVRMQKESDKAPSPGIQAALKKVNSCLFWADFVALHYCVASVLASYGISCAEEIHRFNWFLYSLQVFRRLDF